MKNDEKVEVFDAQHNPMPFGYNADGTVNEREGEVVRYMLDTFNKYFDDPPQKLMDQAYQAAEELGEHFTHEEAQDFARVKLSGYIAAEVREKFPDVRYRIPVSPAVDIMGIFRVLEQEEIIDRSVWQQVQAIISKKQMD